MEQVRVRIAEDGAVVLPAAYRKALGAQAGDELILRLEGEEVRIMNLVRAIKRVQVWARTQDNGRLMSEELIAERRAEAERE